jgi:argininosuccinate lyase
VTKLWGGRFNEPLAPEAFAFTESLSFDRLLVAEDCAVLAAHARALARAGLLGADESDQVGKALEMIARDVATGAVVLSEEDEDIHSAVERLLLERFPDIAPKVRAGLSRNDRVVAALRLWLLRHGRAAASAVSDLIEVLIAHAVQHPDALIPGYTHLQRAQPVSLAHHLLAHAAAFERDARRMLDALARADSSPLGAGALAGSTLGLDTEAIATELGFGGVAANSIDAVSDRDFVAEFLAAAAICGVHCSRIGEELVLWTSAEFGFAELADSYATGSSLMPQKKNPDVAELARAKAGRLIGALTGLLATLKGLPLAYNRDLQEDKEPLFDAVATLLTLLPALTGALRTITFDTEAMARAADDPVLLATDLAEHLVKKGTAFRDAHEQIGRMVREAADQGRSLRDVTANLEALAPGAENVLDAAGSIEMRAAPGPSASSIARQVERLEASLAEIRKAVA